MNTKYICIGLFFGLGACADATPSDNWDLDAPNKQSQHVSQTAHDQQILNHKTPNKNVLLNHISDTTRKAPPVPESHKFINDTFQKIYTYIDYACAIDHRHQTHCWGPAIDGKDGQPGRLSEWELADIQASTLTLEHDAIYKINTLSPNAFLYRQNEQIAKIYDERKYTSGISHGTSLCALGDYAKPYQTLFCAGPRNSYLPYMLKATRLLEKQYSKFKFNVLLPGVRFNAICGLTMDGDVVCGRQVGDRQTVAGPFTDLEYQNDGNVCALDKTQTVQCWSFWSDEPHMIKQPGQYKQLYSAHCGLRSDDKVVCWGGALGKDTHKYGPVIIYPNKPRAFAILHQQGQANWCAISQAGEVQCAKF